MRRNAPPLPPAAVSDSAPGGTNCCSHAADALTAPDERDCLRLLDGDPSRCSFCTWQLGSVQDSQRCHRGMLPDRAGVCSCCQPAVQTRIRHAVDGLSCSLIGLIVANEKVKWKLFFLIVSVGLCGDFLPQIEPHQAEVVHAAEGCGLHSEPQICLRHRLIIRKFAFHPC